jgi:lysophospholipase L1-like esterase
MKRISRLIVFIILLLFIFPIGGCSMLPPSVEISFPENAPSEYLLTNGRVYYDGGELKLFWTSSGFTVNFNGTGLTMTASAHSDHGEPGNSFVNVYIDNSPVPNQTVQFTALEPTEYVLAENLLPGNHTIRVAKRVQPTQYDQINIGVQKLNVTGEDATFLKPPAPPKLQIEFLGDSITCGQGNLLYADRDNGNKRGASAEDGTLTYAALTAASFGAANQTLARSGIKFIRFDEAYINPDSRADRRDSLTDYYTKTAAVPSFEPNPAEWDFARPSDAVVINLGTNDDGQFAYAVPGADILGWYQSEAEYLLELVREKNPKAIIVWCYGMMGENIKTAGPIKKAVEARNNAGDTNVFYLSMANSNNIEGRGDGHPTVAGNINRSYDLVRFIAEKTGWEYSFQPQLTAKLYSVQDYNIEILKSYTPESVNAFSESIRDAYTLLTETIWLDARFALLGIAPSEDIRNMITRPTADLNNMDGTAPGTDNPSAASGANADGEPAPPVADGAISADDRIRAVTDRIQSAWRGLEKAYGFLNRDGWTARASLNNASANKALDGRSASDNDRWTTGAEQNEAIKGAWFQLDRGAGDTAPFSGVHVNYGPSGDYPRGSAVYISNDPETDWADADYANWSGKAAEGGINLTDEYRFPETNARFVRIVYTAEGTAAWWSIYELNLLE